MIVDAGPLIAYIDTRDRHHTSCLRLLEQHPGPLRVPTLVIAEVVQVVASRMGTAAEVAFLADVASGLFSVIPVEPADWIEIAGLTARYADLPLGTIDASVVVTATRLRDHDVATLDRRHFDELAGELPFTLLPTLPA